jgi:hypothetical protein
MPAAGGHQNSLAPFRVHQVSLVFLLSGLQYLTGSQCGFSHTEDRIEQRKTAEKNHGKLLETKDVD